MATTVLGLRRFMVIGFFLGEEGGGGAGVAYGVTTIGSNSHALTPGHGIGILRR
jgi:hypothetical protein